MTAAPKPVSASRERLIALSRSWQAVHGTPVPPAPAPVEVTEVPIATPEGAGTYRLANLTAARALVEAGGCETLAHAVVKIVGAAYRIRPVRLKHSVWQKDLLWPRAIVSHLVHVLSPNPRGSCVLTARVLNVDHSIVLRDRARIAAAVIDNAFLADDLDALKRLAAVYAGLIDEGEA